MSVLRRKKKNIPKIKGILQILQKGVRNCCGCLFLFCLIACKSSDREVAQKIAAAKLLIKSGDIIMRNGRDGVSRVARSFNRRDKTYSHCGILQVENDSVFVYHAIGGGYNRSQALLREPIEKFCLPKEADKFAVFRYPLNDEQVNALTTVVKKHYAHKLLFDWYFNFDTDDRMYCSEFVFKCMNGVLKNELQGFLPQEQDPVYVSIDDLYLNDMAILIFEAQF